jgi:hypothetical protein
MAGGYALGGALTDLRSVRAPMKNKREGSVLMSSRRMVVLQVDHFPSGDLD